MTSPYYDADGITIYHGDCLDILRTLPDCSVDAVVTDPPYGLEFMGKEWDGADGFRRSLNPADAGRDSVFGRASRTSPEYRAGHLFQQWCTLWAAECLRVLKPGGHLISAGGSRTFHRMTCGVEDAGFEIRDTITWHFGSGFPKSLNVSDALGKLPACACDVPREVGAVDAVSPAGSVRAGVGAEPRPMALAGLTADGAVRVGPQMLATGPSRVGGSDMDALDVDGCGELLPVVLGASTVAAAAECQQVVGAVRGIEVDPEPLGNQVVGEQPITSPAVGAGAIPGDHVGGNVGPASPLVLPLATAPSGVIPSSHAGAIPGGHALPGAVGRGVSPSAELDSTDGAGMDPVASASHGTHSTAERAVRCEACGGVRGQIPQGLGTALKPATEFFVVARKPLAGTVAQTVLAHGTGALNIDGCRVGFASDADERESKAKNQHADFGTDPGGNQVYGDFSMVPRRNYNPPGRWPANVVLDETAAAMLDEQSGTSVSRVGAPRRAASGDGWGMTATGAEYSDSGGASRFFYTAKADAAERPAVDGVRHPTVKPLDLMRWLVRLVTPPGGVVLDPFAGSGTTVEACLLEGFRCIAVERESDYLPLVVARITRQRDPVAHVRLVRDPEPTLFDEDAS